MLGVVYTCISRVQKMLLKAIMSTLYAVDTGRIRRGLTCVTGIILPWDRPEILSRSLLESVEEGG